jgi:hypothetical protein
MWTLGVAGMRLVGVQLGGAVQGKRCRRQGTSRCGLGRRIAQPPGGQRSTAKLGS